LSDTPPIRIFRTRRLLDTPFIRVDENRISYRRPDGSFSPEQTRLNVDRGNAVAAILFDPATKHLHLVRQFRFSTYDFADEPDPANGWTLEVVAGGVKPGEALRDCLRREVMEETGFSIDSEIEMIGSFFLSPGASSERLFLFYAEVSEGRRATPKKDMTYGVDDEEISTVAMTVPEFLAAIDRMEIRDAKTIAAGEWLRRRSSKVSAPSP
jgi:ADP-ribose pyrophosphatase